MTVHKLVFWMIMVLSVAMTLAGIYILWASAMGLTVAGKPTNWISGLSGIGLMLLSPHLVLDLFRFRKQKKLNNTWNEF